MKANMFELLGPWLWQGGQRYRCQPCQKIVVGGIAMAPLVQGLQAEEVFWVVGLRGGDFPLPSNAGRFFRLGEDGPLPDSRAVHHSGGVDQDSCQLKFPVGYCASKDMFCNFL